jgi:N12 class adenine-specific DNA methylase
MERRRHIGMGDERRMPGELLADALNSRVPQIFDTIQGWRQRAPRPQRRRYRGGQGEAAEDQGGVPAGSGPTRSHRPAGARLTTTASTTSRHEPSTAPISKLPGASGAFVLYGHQKRGIWRIISAGSTYLAHAVGAGKTMTMAAAIMEQRRLGLIAKAMLVVPGHCLAQAAREFLALYPNARILVADETNFTKDKRRRFLSRAATATWDAIIITHSAFRFIACPRPSNNR